MSSGKLSDMAVCNIEFKLPVHMHIAMHLRLLPEKNGIITVRIMKCEYATSH